MILPDYHSDLRTSSQLKVIGLPFEYCEILMGQADHLEMRACHQLRGHTYTL